VDGHQLHAVVDLRCGIGQSLEIAEGHVERGAEQIGRALRQIVETTPKEIEIGARHGIDALRATQAKPDFFEPGAKCRGGACGTETLGEFQGMQHPLHSGPTIA
jgi:hypothetical protein